MVRVLIGVLLVAVCVVADDPAYEWGQWAFKECRAAVREAGEKKVPRGLCDKLQEVLESYIETTGHQLAEAMTVSFSTVLGPRLREEPYKTTGEQGVHSTIQEMIAKGTRDEQEMEKHVGSWGSSWLLKAAAGDKPGAGMGGKAAHLEQMQKIMQAANGGTVDLSGAGGEASTEQEDLELARRNEDL